MEKLTEWEMYAHRSEFRPGIWMHVFSSPVQVSMCGPFDIVEVKVTETTDGLYYGWIDTKRNWPSMIFPTEKLFEICFTCGSAASVVNGNGRVVRLSVEECKHAE